MTTVALVEEHANTVEQMHGTGAIFCIRIGECSLSERMFTLAHHDRVCAELRRRGWRVKANVVNDDIEGEVVTIRLLTGPAWRNAVSVP